MDTILVILICVLIALLSVAYVFNRVPRIRDLDALFTNVRLMDPSTTAFTLRYDEKSERYVNVSYNDKGEAVSKLERYPVNRVGEYLVPNDHGVVEDLTDGFRISGFTLQKFECPEGYVGPACASKPLCVAGTDDGKLKALTYTQFNDLHLSYADGGIKAIGKFAESTHPRIRVQCFENGEYELQSCPENKLLDENLNCAIYDICQDKIGGYKHNNAISEAQATSSPLEPNEYYICENGASVRTRCSDGTVFSAASNGCITKSVCFGKGETTIARDDKSYVKCSNDIGTVVKCTDRAAWNAKAGAWHCVTSNCKPETLYYSDDVITYAYGRVDCVNDEPKVIECSTDHGPKRFDYEWAEKFSYTVNNWPREVLNVQTGACEPASLDMIRGPVNLAWSGAMRSAHPFDLKTARYVCDETTTKYRWDYANGVTIPATELFVDTGAPCQTEAVTTPPWKYAKGLVRYPVVDPAKPFTAPPLLIGEPVHFDAICWPTYSLASGDYAVDLIDVDETARTLTVSRYETRVPPLGFVKRDETPNDQRSSVTVDLVGFGVPTDPQRYKWYTIASGKFDAIQCSGVPKTQTIYRMRDTIPLTENATVPIIWSLLSPDSAPFLTDVDGKKYRVSSGGLSMEPAKTDEPTTTILYPGHVLLQITKNINKNNIVDVRITRSLTISVDLSIQKEAKLNLRK